MKAPDFAGAAREALAFLQDRVGLDLWLITRSDDADWVVLASADRGLGVRDGDVFRWADTLCSRMLSGEGPRVAPRVADVPALADAPIVRQLGIASYVGAPLVDAEGRFFGTLCGLGRSAQPDALAREQGLVEVFADMLSGLLSAELHSSALAREADAARSGQLADPLTGLANRRGLEQAVATEEERCRRYGATACIVEMELDGRKPAPGDAPAREARDALIARAAHALRHIVRKPDTLARVEDDRFVVLGVECTTAEALALMRRLEQGLQGADAPAALGMAMRNRSTGLAETLERAQAAMEEHRDARARGLHPPAP